MSSSQRAPSALAAGDHRRIGRDLDLFHIDPEIGPGLPLWLPAGVAVRDALEALAREVEFRAGYRRVITPHITRERLYHRSGHLPLYGEHMFPPMIPPRSGGDAYVLRPMNCPHHHRVFAARPRSFRDLPLRLAEHGQVYRYEDSGALSGLMRARGMCINDAHIYCAPEQIQGELEAALRMHQAVYELLGLSGWRARLSMWDPDDPRRAGKYVDDPDAWAESQARLAAAAAAVGLDVVEAPGEAAFYGPKIDFQLVNALGREETASTCQLDFAVPARMGLSYITSGGGRATPWVIHRAPLGTHERFVAFLAEHYGGAFPTWMAPVQALVLCVADRQRPYGQAVVDRLRAAGVRAELGAPGARLGGAIREAAAARVPNLLIVGAREAAAGAVCLRRRGGARQEVLSLEAAEGFLLGLIKGRHLDAPAG